MAYAATPLVSSCQRAIWWPMACTSGQLREDPDLGPQSALNDRQALPQAHPDQSTLPQVPADTRDAASGAGPQPPVDTDPPSVAAAAEALAVQGRSAEAHLLVAGAPFEDSTRAALHKGCARASPDCYGFAEGLLLKPTGRGGWGVFAGRAFEAQECVLREEAAVRWGWEDLVEDAALVDLLALLQTCEGRAEARRLNGLFPRAHTDIPDSVPLLEELKEIVQELYPDLPEAAARETTRLLAVIALNAHEDGLHGFGSMFNHHCVPNCEVRGDFNVEVFCCRDIAPGEELCISYRAPGELDLSVEWRCFRFAEKWGLRCGCSRCRQDLQAIEDGVPVSDAAIEKRALAVLQWYEESLCPLTDGISDMHSRLDAAPVLELMQGQSLPWRGTKWKELAVLEWYRRFLSRGLALHAAEEPLSAETLQDALRWLVDLYELQLEVKAEGSVALCDTRDALLDVMELCADAAAYIPRDGYDSVAALGSTAERFSTVNRSIHATTL